MWNVIFGTIIVTNLFHLSGKEPVAENIISLSSIFTLIAKDNDLLKWDTRHGATQAHLLGIVASQFIHGKVSTIVYFILNGIWY